MIDLDNIFGTALLMWCRGDTRGRPSLGDGSITALQGLSMLGGQIGAYPDVGGPSVLNGVLDGHDAMRVSGSGQSWGAPMDGGAGMHIQTGDRLSVFCVMRRVGGAPASSLPPWSIADVSFVAPRVHVLFNADGTASFVLHYDNGGAGANAESVHVPLDDDFHLFELHFDQDQGHGALDGVEVDINTGGAGAGGGFGADPTDYYAYAYGLSDDAYALSWGTPHDLVEYVLVLGAITSGQKLAARARLAARYPSLGIAT